ncbi:AaceriABR056Cp [[Ashbya] aceris (nom. inval.)]|nr:AaceriABR056Cp [[Ashbya] aceris (nom. inval.)]
MFRQSKRRVAQRRHGDGEDGATILAGLSAEEEHARYEQLYPAKLSFYPLPPVGEITLDQFETWAIDRLKVLLELESLIQRNRSAKELEHAMKPLLGKLLPLGEDLDARRKDYYSHFILRLCFCRTSELRERFVRAETALFRLRFQMLTSADQGRFVQSLDLPLLQFIDEAEKQALGSQLYDAVAPQLLHQLQLTDEAQRRQFFQHERFLKLPFESVIDLVGPRHVLLRRGWAYLPQFMQLNHIAGEYAARLAADLRATYQHLPALASDDRLPPILEHLSAGHVVAPPPPPTGDGLSAADLAAEPVRAALPLCARNLLDGLAANHHLRYLGRQQLALFLKAAGMSADDALRFWADAFTAGPISLDRFNREYRYALRHTYGLEGNRINYRPWDCRTILAKPRPARNEFHGCPYRDWSPDRLGAALAAMQLAPPAVAAVRDACARREYTLACTQVFDALHGHVQTPGHVPAAPDMSHIVHPNQYFERARPA